MTTPHSNSDGAKTTVSVPKNLHSMPTPQIPSTSAPDPDPVIRMLAQRAGTDTGLKAVMKVVAAGSATKDQLEFFQSHINELTSIVQKQNGVTAKVPLPLLNNLPPALIVQSTQQSQHMSRPPSPPPTQFQRFSSTWRLPRSMQTQFQPYRI